MLHAGWNVLLAGSRDLGASTAGILIFGVALLAPPALLTGGVSAEAIPFIAGSAALELAYFVLLARAYAGGEVSVIYPIARGSAPVVVLVFGAIALSQSVSLGAAAGVLIIAAGVLLVGFGAFPFRFARESATPLRDVWFGLAIGVVIASYTLVDSEAVEHADPIAYLALVIAPCALVYPFVAKTRPDLSPRTALTAAATFGAFLMVLAAFRLAPAAPVAAVRETSVVIAAILAAVVLHEHVGPRRIAGAILVAAGVVAIV
ncbi:MAG TPA: EamA family transporter, partial [Thermoleophilaceae bacterium]|nr:EamA family transporter [Thermoleophilaceae bacterium]